MTSNKTWISLLLLFLLPGFATAQLTGEWQDQNGVCYRMRQVDNELWWFADNSPRVMNVFHGLIAGNSITGKWADIPGGQNRGGGTIALRIESNNRIIKTDQSGMYGLS